MKKHTFYIGLNDKDTKTQLISTLDAYRITTIILCCVLYCACHY